MSVDVVGLLSSVLVLLSAAASVLVGLEKRGNLEKAALSGGAVGSSNGGVGVENASELRLRPAPTLFVGTNERPASARCRAKSLLVAS